MTCIDFSAELADISVMDPWIRDNSGHYIYSQHYSMAFLRNSQGLELIHRAKDAGHLLLKELPPNIQKTSSQLIERSQFKYSQRLKKRIIPARIDRYKKLDKPSPLYNVDFPPPSRKEFNAERFDTMLMALGKWKWSRKIVMRLFFSGLGVRLIVLHNIHKKKKVASRLKNI